MPSWGFSNNNSGSNGQNNNESNLGKYGAGIRTQVFEVIVRQALAGAPWRVMCAGPMKANSINPDDVVLEANARYARDPKRFSRYKPEDPGEQSRVKA